ncbi:uncharacterized protein [Venturia canescens]|uniref:uncharacterized protein isoform X2 n=1 Tax=Venturia canescens TaxID=32260 RepID=UPI001C9CF561|nr:uncharacterized protein LOC122412642 isoform X2 [Venturia canescens]
MKTCCVKGCDTSRYITLKYYAFFNFPLDNEDLLKKWLNQIGQPDLKPKHHQICSVHFKNDDILWRPDGLPPSLNPTAVPTIFPPQESNTATPQSGTSTFLEAISTESILKSSNKENNGNSKFPLIIIPTQYLFPYPPLIPYAIPTQFSPQFSTQFHPQNQLQTHQSFQINSQNSLPNQPVSQIISQSSQHTQPITQIHFQDLLLSEPVPQMKPLNLLQTQPVLQIDSQNSLSTQLPHIDPKCSAQLVQYMQSFNAMNSALSIQLAQQVTTQNPAIIGQFAQDKAQTLEKSSQVSKIKETPNLMDISLDSNTNDNETGKAINIAQDSMKISQIPSSNGRNFVPTEDSGPPESLKNTSLRFYSKKKARNPFPNDPKSAMTSQKSGVEKDLKNLFSEELKIEKNLQVTMLNPMNLSEIKEEKPDVSFAEKSNILQQISGENCPKVTFPLEKEFQEEEVFARRFTKPDYLLIPKKTKFANPKHMDHTRRPTLRISIKKLCNVPLESKNFNEKENSSDEQKSITIENHATNKSVTFRLDSRTGEIIVKNQDIIPTRRRRDRNTGRKRKRRFFTGRKSSSALRKRA